MIPHTDAARSKEKKISFLENVFNKTGKVLAVRSWEPATFYEVDVHLPGIDMSKWRDTQHIKCKVGSFTYRDYTPASWDADTQTCTMYIDAAHDGAGSSWVKTLQPGDPFYYMGLASSRQRPTPGARHVLLGDQSAIGHFAAMQQLTAPGTQFTGAVVMKEPHHSREFKEYFPELHLDTILQNEFTSNVADWVKDYRTTIDSVFYLVGNAVMVSGLRKALKQNGISSNQIKAQGFWH